MTQASFAIAKRRQVAVVAGATGLVGRELVNALLADSSVGAVHVLVRSTNSQFSKRNGLTQHVVDYSQPIPGFGLSVATWSGVIGFAKTLSLEVARHNVNVNTICPGYVETKRLEKVFAAGGEDPNIMREKLRSEVPLGRIGTVDDIASIVALLVSPRGRYITGTAVPVDGGLFRAVR